MSRRARLVLATGAISLVVVSAVAWTTRLTAGGPRAWVGAALVIVTGVVAVVVVARVPRPVPRRLAVYLAGTAIVLMSLLALACSFRLVGDAGALVAGPLAFPAVVLAVIGAATWLVALALAARAVGGRCRERRAAGPPRAAPRPLGAPAILVALLVLWLPALLLLLPGSTTYDGTRQLNEWWGVSVSSLDFTYVPTNHHPWFATVWQGLLVALGMGLSGGDVNAGLLAHTVALTAASLATYTVAILRIQRWSSRGWALVAVAFFGVLPHFANYAALYEKTGWYQLALMWFYLGVVDVVLHRGTPLTQATQLIAGGALASLFRANGVYIVVGSLVVLALCSLRSVRHRVWLLATASAVAVLAVFVAWTAVALPRLGVGPASPGEAMVVPFQQVARIVVEHGDELTRQERAAIDAVMPLERIPGAYAPENGDGVKSLYEIDTFLITEEGVAKMRDRDGWWLDDQVATDRARFLATWVGLVERYPVTATTATVANTSLYVAPTLNRGVDVSLFSGGLPDYELLVNPYTGQYRHLLGEQANAILAWYYVAWARLPVADLLVNPGLYGWIVIALALSLCFWRRAGRLALLATPLLVYAVNFAGARNGDFRYTVPLVALLPVCLAAWWAVRSRRGAAVDAEQRELAVTAQEGESGGPLRDPGA